MNTHKLKVIAYVLRKYLQGYTLLKNPSGTPGTSVTMLQNRSWMESDTLDIHDSYIVLSADFSGAKKKEIKELLFSTKYAFFDKETYRLTYRKGVQYYKMGDTPAVSAHKGPDAWDIQQGRNLDHVDRPVARVKEEKIIYGHLGMPLDIRTIEEDKTFGEYVKQHYDKQERKADIARLQFREGLFKKLRYNLSR